jgi:hypothetical protein
VLIPSPHSRAWFLLPQVVSRLSAVVTFAFIANSTSTDALGVFAIISAVGSGAVALGPAMVAKPLAATADASERRKRAHFALSAVVLSAATVGAIFASAAMVTSGLVRLTLAGAALMTWGAAVLEAAYWTGVFSRNPRRAGTANAIAYAAQAVVAAIAVRAINTDYVVLVPPGVLSLAAIVTLLRQPPSFANARAWYRDYKATWLPYVGGSAASIAMIQAIPLIVTAKVGLGGASVFRALEIAFGPTNLAAAVTGNSLLARDVHDARGELRVYRRAGTGLALIAIANGLLLILTPFSVIEGLLGSAAGVLRDDVVVASLFRVGQAVSTIGLVVLIPLYPARRIGAINVLSVVATITALIGGLLLDDLAGAFAALAAVEAAWVVAFWFLIKRRMSP